MYLKINTNLLVTFLALSSLSFVQCRNQNKDNTVPSASDAASQFYSVVTFGDSLSDSGSIKYLTQQFAGETSPLLKRSVPIEPASGYSGYYKGRFSNGENWLDRFMKTLDLQMQDFETCYLRGSNSSCDYAIGGATTDENLTSDKDPMSPVRNLFKDDIVNQILNSFKIPQHVGIKQMVTTYLDVSQPNQDVLNHTLYVIWGGGNDYFANEVVSTTVSNLISSIKHILDYNPDQQKRYFLIPNLPDLSKTPYGIAHPDLNLKEKTFKHNFLLEEQIESEITKNPQYKDKAVVVVVDVDQAFSEVYKNPSEYGFTNLTDACYKGSYMPGQEGVDCGEANHYVFWDNIHPTTKIHCMVTKVALLGMAQANLLNKPEVAKNFKCDDNDGN